MATEEELLMAKVSGRLTAAGLFDEANICNSLWSVMSAARKWIQAPIGAPANDAERLLVAAIEEWNNTRIEILNKRTP